MKNEVSSAGNDADTALRILRVLEEVTSRRIAGESVSDEAVIAAHADLMPGLGEKLNALRRAERARGIATDSTRKRPAEDEPAVGKLPDIAAPVSDSFHGYELQEEIGRGAMGVVYRAVQTRTRRSVAVKVMMEGPFAGPTDRARFEREAQILGQLKHPNIVTVYDTGVAEGRFYIVMDYVAGQPLDAHLAGTDPRRASDVRPTLELFARVCDAAGAAHLRGVIHRDLKPSNIRVDEEGEPHILDFGLAKTSGGNGKDVLSTHDMTMTGQFVGSLPWASPEQAEGRPEGIDVRTDVYALGVILYQILTKRFPYPVVGNIRDVVDHILRTEPAKPSTVSRHIDSDVETILLKCLAKEPDRRYQSAIEMARDIRHYLVGDPIEAKRDSAWYVLRKTLRRYRIPAAVVAIFVILLAGFGVTMSVMYGRAQLETERARRTIAFLQETLFEASSRRLGPNATLLQVLDEVARRVEAEFEGQPEVAAAIHYTIGDAYESLWRPQESAKHLEAAQRLYEESYGPEHPDTLRCTVLLGMVLGELRDPRAIRIQEEALRTRQRLYGGEHVDVAQSMSELAYVLWTTAVPPRWDEAEQYYREALAMYRKLQGPRHPDVARQSYVFGLMYHVQGRYDVAEPLYRESLDLSRDLLGTEHQFVIECMGSYAGVLQELERFDEAESMLTKVISLTPRRFGKVWLPQMLRRMAALQMEKGDPAAARRWFADSITEACRQLAESHPDAAERMNRLASTFATHPALGSEEPSYMEALLAIHEVTSAPLDTVGSLVDFAELLRAPGSPEANVAAEPALREAMRILDDLPQRPERFAGYAASLLGQCLTKQGRYEEAEGLLIDAHSTLLAIVGPRHRMTVDAVRYLVELYEAWGKPEKAARYQDMLPERQADARVVAPS